MEKFLALTIIILISHSVCSMQKNDKEAEIIVAVNGLLNEHADPNHKRLPKLLNKASAYKTLNYLTKQLLEYGTKPTKGIVNAVNANNISAVKMLIENGADVTYVPRKSLHGALHLAVLNANLAMLKLILNAKAEPNTIDSIGNTPLMYCVSTNSIFSATLDNECIKKQALRQNLVKVLLEAGANNKQKNKNGKTASEIAQQNDFKNLADLIEHNEYMITPIEKGSSLPSPESLNSFDDPDLSRLSISSEF